MSSNSSGVRVNPISRHIESRISLRRWQWLFLGSAMFGCGGGDAGTPNDPTTPQQTTYALSLYSGGDQRARVTLPLTDPIVVVVRSTSGTPKSGVSIAFSPSSGTVSPAAAVTDGEGKASTRWTLGNAAGAQTLSVTASGVSGALTVTATADAASQVFVTIADGDRQQAVTGTAVMVPPAVVVRDAGGAPVTGAQVRFAVLAGGGAVLNGTVTTGASGTAAVGGWTLGAAGAQELRVELLNGDIAAASLPTFRATAVAAGGVVSGPVRSTTLSSASALSVQDTVSGLRVVFPQGAHGTLEVARVQSIGNEPAQGLNRFTARYTGTERVEVAVPTNGGEVAAYVFGQISDAATSGSFASRWWAIPIQRTQRDTAFILVQSGGAAGMARRSALRAGSAANRIDAYAVVPVPAGSAGATERAHYRAGVQQTVDWWLAELPAARSTQLRDAITTRPWSLSTGSSGESYYWYSLFTGYVPTLYLNTTRELGHVTRHEAAHYLTHMVVGDARYQELLDSAPGEGHDLGVVAGRGSLIEEYAHLTEFLMGGNVTGYDLRSLTATNNLRHMFGGITPDSKDVPGLEGFGAALAAALTRTSGDTAVYHVHSATGRSTAPALGVASGALLGVLAGGPRTVDELQSALAGLVGESALAAAAEPIGWSYNGFGRIVDANSLPVPNVNVASIVRVNGRDYRTPASTATGADGKFWLPRIYPGTSKLRAYIPRLEGGTDSVDIGTANAAWSAPTNVALELGEFKLLNTSAYNSLYIYVVGITGENAAGGTTCRDNFIINSTIPNGYLSTIDFPLTWSGLSFQTSGSTSYMASSTARNAHSVSATGTLTPGKGDTIFVTLSAASSTQDESLVNSIWTTTRRNPATLELRNFPLRVSTTETKPTLTATLSGSYAMAVMGAWNYTYWFRSALIPEQNPQDCSKYQAGANTRITVTIRQK